MQSRRHRIVVLGFTLTLLAAGFPTAADDGVTITTTIPGSLELADNGIVQERVTMPPGVLAVLATTREGAAVTIQQWPVAPGRRRPVTLRRHVVVDPDARRLLVTPDGAVPLPGSSRVHLWGDIAGEHGRALVSLDPSGADLRGFVIGGGDVYELIPDGSDHLVVSARDRHDAGGSPLQPWTCGLEDDGLEVLPGPAGGQPTAGGGQLESSGHTATIAFDTDTELLQLKFGNNQAAALDYIADLVAAMNVMYERDLDVTLVQGETYLRVGPDPYSQNSGGAASSAELGEFSSYWSSHYGSVDRALAAMLSGKSPSPNSASGIAWVGGLCSSSYGYSFTKVFLVDYLAGDAFVVGHELGHNFGSRHTHCYSPPIDECFAGEGGCYQGPTSCPGGPGTVMSYCHIAGCGMNLLQFHTRVITNILSNYVAPAIGVCIFPAGAGEPLFADGFESGDTDSWSAAGP
jgi:hypothetical protein